MQFDQGKYKIINRKNLRVIIWMANPLSAIYELIFGIRLPKIQLLEKTNKKPRWERLSYPCPHCHTIHNIQTWSSSNKTNTKNWFGLYCPSCEKIIPCITSLFSYLALALTFPLWFFFRNFLKRKWLSQQPLRFQNIDVNTKPDPYPLANWVQNSLGWGLWMFVAMGLLLPLAERKPLKSNELLLAISWWMIGGFLYGYCMKLWYVRQKRKGKLNQ